MPSIGENKSWGEACVLTLGAVRHDRVGSLRVQNCPASEEEWQTILERLFAHEPQPEIQASASVQRDSSISIIVRKNIQGITVSFFLGF